MSVFTADEVRKAAEWLEINVPGSHYLMLQELERRLRQDAEDSRRDPGTDPLPGDRAIDSGAEFMFADETNVYVTCSKAVWRAWTARKGITFARRGEFTRCATAVGNSAQGEVAP